MLFYVVRVDKGDVADAHAGNCFRDEAANTSESNDSYVQASDVVLESGTPGIE